MTPELQNKLLARRFLEEMVNTGAVERLSEFLAPEYVAPLLGITGIDQARDHLLTFRRCYPDMAFRSTSLAHVNTSCNSPSSSASLPNATRLPTATITSTLRD